MVWVTFFFIDRIGRRILLFGGAIFSLVWLAAFILFAHLSNSNNHTVAYIYNITNTVLLDICKFRK